MPQTNSKLTYVFGIDCYSSSMTSTYFITNSSCYLSTKNIYHATVTSTNINLNRSLLLFNAKIYKVRVVPI